MILKGNLRCGSRPLFPVHHIQRRVHDELVQVRRLFPRGRCSPSAAAAAAGVAAPLKAKVSLVERLVSPHNHKDRHGSMVILRPIQWKRLNLFDSHPGRRWPASSKSKKQTKMRGGAAVVLSPPPKEEKKKKACSGTLYVVGCRVLESRAGRCSLRSQCVSA